MGESEGLGLKNHEVDLEARKLALAIQQLRSSERMNWIQLVISFLGGVLVAGLIGYGNYKLTEEHNEAEGKRAADTIEVQVMTLVAPQFGQLRDVDQKGETSRRIVLAAATFLSEPPYGRSGLAKIFWSIIDKNPSVAPEIRMSAEEATVPAQENSGWYVVLASLPANNLDTAREVARQKAEIAKNQGLNQAITLYRTKISNNIAIVIGGKMTQQQAGLLAASAREKGLAADAFAQRDRSWEEIKDHP